MRRVVIVTTVLAAATACAPRSGLSRLSAPANAPASAAFSDRSETTETSAPPLYSRPHTFDEYALDGLDRTGPPRGQRPVCSNDEVISYRGKTLAYAAPARVHRAFAERLARFEALVEEVSIEVYGRAPKLIHHAGGFMCRTSQRGRMSEHAFGNAIDLDGFSFAPIGKNDLAQLEERGVVLETPLRRAFRIDVGEVWREGSDPHGKRFFALLLARARAREGLFRGMIGPPDPAHRTHLHLDAGPWAFSRFSPP